jgi:hypothetical protein
MRIVSIASAAAFLFSLTQASAAKPTCYDLKSAQKKLQSQSPFRCDLAKDIAEEYQAQQKEFLKSCEAMEKRAKGASAEERLKLQSFLDVPSLTELLDQNKSDYEGECEADMKAVLAFRALAQKVVTSVNAKER